MSEAHKFIIVVRNPRSKLLIVIEDGGEDDGRRAIAMFETEEEAEEAAMETTFCRAWPYQIIKVDI